jgi:hypothetical protein
VRRPKQAQTDELKSELLMAAGVQRDLDAARERLGATSDELGLIRAALEREQAEARKAAQAAEALRRAEAERRARGFVARLRATWRGE